MEPCPVCGMGGGFHDHASKEGKHAQHEVPRELLLEPGWYKVKEEPVTEEVTSVERLPRWWFVLATRMTMRLFGVRLSRPCYDKPHRCPGWAGGGWKGARVKLCPEIWDGDIRLRSGYVTVDYEQKWWKWRFHSCLSCHVVTLPYAIHWASWRTWWWNVRLARSQWRWLFRLETWWGKKRGWW